MHFFFARISHSKIYLSRLPFTSVQVAQQSKIAARGFVAEFL